MKKATAKSKVPSTNGKRKEEEHYTKRYPHIVKGSLHFDKKHAKQVVTIKTVDANGKPDGNTREIATSDLHHTRHTEEVAKEVRLAKIRASRKARKAPKKAAAAKG